MENTRPFNAGRQLGEAICEVANILYLLDNKKQFITGLLNTLNTEYDKTTKEILLKQSGGKL